MARENELERMISGMAPINAGKRTGEYTASGRFIARFNRLSFSGQERIMGYLDALTREEE